MSGTYTGNTFQVQTKKHPRALSQTLEVMTVQLKKYLTSRAYLDGESHALSLQSYICSNIKSSATMAFVQTKSKRRCMTIEHHKPNTALSTNTSYQLSARCWRGDDLGLFCRTCCSHWVDHQLVCIPRCSRVKCESNVWKLKLGLKKRRKCCNGTVLRSRP